MQNNPYRYRGYYFDKDLNLYYLNARYYDQCTGRFISAEPNVYSANFDVDVGLICYNTYVYCVNDGVNKIDPTGQLEDIILVLD